MDDVKRRRLVAGAILIAVGLFGLFAERLAEMGEGLFFGTIGLAFLVAYLWSRNYGFLVPAGILLGMGLGFYLRVLYPEWDASILLGMGIGFFFVWLVHLAYQRDNLWWPVFPGTALVLLGIPWTREWFALLFERWELLVIAVGVAFLVAALFTRRRPPAEAGSSAEDERSSSSTS